MGLFCTISTSLLVYKFYNFKIYSEFNQNDFHRQLELVKTCTKLDLCISCRLGRQKKSWKTGEHRSWDFTAGKQQNPIFHPIRVDVWELNWILQSRAESRAIQNNKTQWLMKICHTQIQINFCSQFADRISDPDTHGAVDPDWCLI
jgi:hypothetical protein